MDIYDIASIADIDGGKVPFLHLNQLIEEKRNVARYKDLEDAEALEKIKKYHENK